MLDDVDVAAIPRGELPALLGAVVELEAAIRLRLAEPAPSALGPARILTVEEAAALAGLSPRSLRHMTRGLGFRKDHSRKCIRFDQAGLVAWLSNKRAARG